MSTPDENLFIAVIYQATADAMGAFTDPSNLEIEFLRIKYKIKNPKIPKKQPKYAPPSFRQRIKSSHHIFAARQWFKMADPDFVSVCDYAGFYWKEVQERFMPTILAIEVYEKKLFDIERPILAKRRALFRRKEVKRMAREKRRSYRAGMDITT